MSRKPYRRKRGGAGRHVQLHEWFQASEAWASLKPGPRAVCVELKRRYTGFNNGRIVLSHRDAAKALNVTRNTVGPWFHELVERGFIRMRQEPCLGPSGIGQSAEWELEELPLDDMKPARKSFMRWPEMQNPRPENRTLRHKNRDAASEKQVQKAAPVLKIVP